MGRHSKELDKIFEEYKQITIEALDLKNAIRRYEAKGKKLPQDIMATAERLFNTIDNI